MIINGYQNGNSYLQQKGPLSDLIMTQQSNLNVVNRHTGSALRKTKRNKSSITVNTQQNEMPPGEPPENSSSQYQDVNGGTPYLFENHKINQAIAQEELSKIYKTVSAD